MEIMNIFFVIIKETAENEGERGSKVVERQL